MDATLPNPALGLFTDYYELLMAQGYFLSGRQEEITVFDYFYRTNPFEGGFLVFAGLGDLIPALVNFRYNAEQLAYLAKLGFHPDFLAYLKDFRFRGKVDAVREGEIVFPQEPLVQVEATIIEAQLIETLLLNILNFQSLIATKSFRMRIVSGNKSFSDFGLRRAHGDGGIQASRAAIIGGANSTSNVEAGYRYGIPVSGTMAHSWVQSFDSELEAFREYVRFNRHNPILLVDTYDTLRSGIPNAIIVAKEMEAEGAHLFGIRLDSGDLAYLSKKGRKQLDQAGLEQVKILASNQLNEFVVRSLNEQKAPIDGYGIGTELVTGKPDASLDGVYKLAVSKGAPRMKISENIEKMTFPGKKALYRYYDQEGNFYRDAILLDYEDPYQCETIYNAVYPDKRSRVSGLSFEPLHKRYLDNLLPIEPLSAPQESQAYLLSRAAKLPEEHQRFIMPHLYKVGCSEALLSLRDQLRKKIRNDYDPDGTQRS